MGRKAKCKHCQTQLDVDMAYKVIVYDTNNKPKNFYYCSKEEYDASEAEKRKRAEDKDKAYKLICEIIGRDEIINTALWKEWKVWNTVATNETIWQYLEENKTYLINIISKLDDIEFNRIRYLSTVLKNKLGDFKPKTVTKGIITAAIQEEHYETKFKLKQRRGLEDLEDDCDE